MTSQIPIFTTLERTLNDISYKLRSLKKLARNHQSFRWNKNGEVVSLGIPIPKFFVKTEKCFLCHFN